MLARLLQTVAPPLETFPFGALPPELPSPEMPAPEMPAAEPPPAEPAPSPAAPPSLPLARLGFGAGMTARLNQLGIHDTADLAATVPASLREALGEISRLVDVDAWIAHARALTAAD